MLWFNSKKIIGLDIGNSNIKACELKFGAKSAKLIHYKQSANSANYYKNGEILNTEALSSIIKSCLNEFKTKNISLGVSGSSVMVKKIVVPKMDTHILSEQIRWEAEQYIPFNIDEVVMDYIPLPINKDSDTMEVVLVAAQKERIEKLKSCVEFGKKFKVTLIDVSSFALSNCFTFNYPEYNDRTVGILDIGAFFTHFIILQNNEIIFSRDIPAGGQLFDEEIAKNLGISEEEAKKIKEAGRDMPDIAIDTIKSMSERYLQQIVGAYEFFIETTQGVELNEFFVTGGGSLIPNLPEKISRGLNTPVNFMNIFRNISVASNILESNSENLQYKAAVAVGLALRKVGDQND